MDPCIDTYDRKIFLYVETLVLGTLYAGTLYQLTWFVGTLNIVRGNLIREVLVCGDLVRWQFVRGDIVCEDLVRGTLYNVHCTGDLIREVLVCGDLVCEDLVRGDLERGNIVLARDVLLPDVPPIISKMFIVTGLLPIGTNLLPICYLTASIFIPGIFL